MPKVFWAAEMNEPKKGVRVKVCGKCPGSGPGGKLVVDRDVNARMNMITIVLCVIISGHRPAAFCPTIQYDGKKE